MASLSFIVDAKIDNFGILYKLIFIENKRIKISTKFSIYKNIKHKLKPVKAIRNSNYPKLNKRSYIKCNSFFIISYYKVLYKLFIKYFSHRNTYLCWRDNNSNATSF